MRIAAWPTAVTVVADIAAWLAIHIGVSWLATRLPANAFKPGLWLFRERAWEIGGRLYRAGLKIHSWKGSIPDAAPWFRGFPKRTLQARDPAYFERFRQETCRAEAAHWAAMAFAPLFFLWNSSAVGVGMVVYAAFANLPCIVIQRYNRIRLRQAAGRRLSGVEYAG